MGLGFTVTIPRDDASPAVASLRAGLQPEQLQPIVGRSARNTYRQHFFGLNGQRGNALGGPRTNFYPAAGRATQFRVEGDHVIVSINQVGIGLRYFGGTVRAGQNGSGRKFLTIPARAEAHGKRASEFSDLVVLFGRNGPYALARAPQSRITVRRDSVTGARTIGRGRVQGGEVIFWLKKSATFRADPSVLPYEQLVEAQAVKAVDAYAKLLWDRQNPSPAGGGN